MGKGEVKEVKARHEIWGNGVIQDVTVIAHIAYLSESIVRGRA
jgi:hypothetical protein